MKKIKNKGPTGNVGASKKNIKSELKWAFCLVGSKWLILLTLLPVRKQLFVGVFEKNTEKQRANVVGALKKKMY